MRLERISAAAAFAIPEDPDTATVGADLIATGDLLRDIVAELAESFGGIVEPERWLLWLVSDLGRAADTLVLMERAASDDVDAMLELRNRVGSASAENAFYAAAGVAGMDLLILAAHAILASAMHAPSEYDPPVDR